MNGQLRFAAFLILALCFTAATVVAGDITKTYPAKERIRINTISGDCVVHGEDVDEITVTVEDSYRPRDSFEPRFSERGNVLKLNEEMFGSNSGSSRWTLTVPANTEIKFTTASGDFIAFGLTGDVVVNTASGDIELTECTGECDMNTASGDIEVRDCGGEMDLKSASGRIRAPWAT